MRKVLLVLSVIVVLAAAFASCRQGSIIENTTEKVSDATAQEATTVIVDENGVTHYYKIVSDNPQGAESTTGLADIATNKSGEPITNSAGEYVTTEYTTAITAETTTAADDNDVSFENTDETTTATEAITETETDNGESTSPDPPTDSEGWIDRWY